MALKDRIREIVEAGHTKAALARASGKTPAAVTHWLNGQTLEIKSDAAAGIQAATGFNAVWIATGKLPKMAMEGQSTVELPQISKSIAIPLEGNPDFPAIRRVRFKLSAGAHGFGVEYRDEDGSPLVFQRRWFESRGLVPDRLFAVKVANGSMEPGLFDGDTVIVNTDKTTPVDGTAFAVNYEGEMVVKRLVRDAGQWWLSSDNPDQRRYPRKICDEHCVLIGEIIQKQSERI